MENIRSQPSWSHSCFQYLRTLTYCHDCLYQDLLHLYDPNDDLTDLLVGEEFDNLVDIDDVEEEMELEDIDVALKDITRFSSSWFSLNCSQ